MSDKGGGEELETYCIYIYVYIYIYIYMYTSVIGAFLFDPYFLGESSYNLFII